MNKGYAFGFLIVLLVLVLGLYVAFTGFRSSRETLRAQAVSRTITKEVQSTRSAAGASPTVTATPALVATPDLRQSSTPTVVVSTAATEPPSSTVPPAPPPTETHVVQPADTPMTPVQPPTLAPAPAYQYRLGGPATADPSYPSCCYVYGMVRDAAGNGLEGVQVLAFNEWNTLPPAVTKGGNEAGQYNIPLGRDVVTWYLVVVDAAGNQISTQSPIPFDPNVANGYRVDWQRTY